MRIEVLVDVKTILGEGPLWDVEQERLYWIDSLGKRVHSIDADGGNKRSWTVPEHIRGRGLRVVRDEAANVGSVTSTCKPEGHDLPSRRVIGHGDRPGDSTETGCSRATAYRRLRRSWGRRCETNRRPSLAPVAPHQPRPARDAAYALNPTWRCRRGV